MKRIEGIVRLRKADLAEIELLYDKYASIIYGNVKHLTGIECRQDWEKLTTDIFLIVYRQRFQIKEKRRPLFYVCYYILFEEISHYLSVRKFHCKIAKLNRLIDSMKGYNTEQLN